MKFWFAVAGPPSLLPIFIPIKPAGLLLLVVLKGLAEALMTILLLVSTYPLSIVLFTADWALLLLLSGEVVTLEYFGISNVVSDALAKFLKFVKS